MSVNFIFMSIFKALILSIYYKSVIELEYICILILTKIYLINKKGRETMVDYNPMKFTDSSKKILMEASKNTLIRLKSKEFGIWIHDEKAPFTISVVFLEEVARVLATEAKVNGDVSAEIAKFMTMSIVNRESENGEKEGNLVPKIEAGPTFKQMVKNDDQTEQQVEEE